MSSKVEGSGMMVDSIPKYTINIKIVQGLFFYIEFGEGQDSFDLPLLLDLIFFVKE